MLAEVVRPMGAAEVVAVDVDPKGLILHLLGVMRELSARVGGPELQSQASAHELCSAADHVATLVIEQIEMSSQAWLAEQVRCLFCLPEAEHNEPWSDAAVRELFASVKAYVTDLRARALRTYELEGHLREVREQVQAPDARAASYRQALLDVLHALPRAHVPLDGYAGLANAVRAVVAIAEDAQAAWRECRDLRDVLEDVKKQIPERFHGGQDLSYSQLPEAIARWQAATRRNGGG